MSVEIKDRFYGRRKGKKLRERQASLFENLLPHLRLDLARPISEPLFSRPVSEIWLEIGFGGGEHLLAEAKRLPDVGFIGVEPFVNGMAKALAAIEDADAQTIRLHHGDAADVIDWLPTNYLNGAYLLYPDPWPKRRHRKRRFVSTERLAGLARALKPGAELRFATDIDDYAAWTLRHVFDRSDLEWTQDWRSPWEGWTSTRYEAKALAEGRKPVYLTFRKREPLGSARVF